MCAPNQVRGGGLLGLAWSGVLVLAHAAPCRYVCRGSRIVGDDADHAAHGYVADPFGQLDHRQWASHAAAVEY
jgi:hypothetical protein